MQCASCGTEVLAGKRFCHGCGAPVMATCGRCGATVQADFRFCADCGAPLGAAAPSAPPANAAVANVAGGAAATDRLSEHMPATLAEKIRASKATIEGERKQVTVLFCDLVGSTAIAERLDPEEYHDLLEQYLEIVFREIYRVEGIVNQLAGDGVMALFGAPVAHEDAPQRAVWAALGIGAALERFSATLRAEQGIELRARFGINTGPVVVGTVGNDLKMDYTAIGDTTNLAARLEGLAEPGTVLVSDSTYRLIRGLFSVRAVGPFAVKGKSDPVMAYEVHGPSATTTPMALAAARGLTPFVGRDDELLHLRSCFERLSGNLAHVVAVVGPAGSGKSRLLYEFREWLTEQAAVVFEARCAALSQLVPYAPWTAMLRQYFRIPPEADAETAHAQIRCQLQTIAAELTPQAPYISHLLGMTIPEIEALPVDEVKRAVFAAVSHLIMAECGRAPVVMVIEDLHWIDEGSREMLERAVAHLNRGRLMLIVSHRPDYQQQWRTSAAFTQINLRPLQDEDAARIMRALAQAPLPGELERLVLNKAEGSPFFTEEITRGLLEGGYLACDEGCYRLTRPVEEIRIPGTVQEVLAARLDRLGGTAKRVLQVAAVMGRQFRREQLEELLADEDIDVGRELELLEERGVIHRKNVFSSDEFRFGESLTQEVAYEGLLLKQRRQLHERVGALLAGGGGSDSVEGAAVLAHHFARSDNREQAAGALLRAAEKAEQVPSYATAARFYREAWDIAEASAGAGGAAGAQAARLAVQAAVGIARMTVIYGQADPGDHQQIVQRGRELAATLGDRAQRANLTAYQGLMVLTERERFAEGLALVEEGLAIAQEAGLSLPALARALAWAYCLDGRWVLARRTIDWAVDELARSDHGQRLSDIYVGSRYLKARIRQYADDFEGALRESFDTYEQAVRAGNRTVQGGTAAVIAETYFMYGQYAEARRWAERAEEMRRAIGHTEGGSTATAIVMAVAARQGEPVAQERIADPEHGLRATDVPLTVHVLVDALLEAERIHEAEYLARVAYTTAFGRLREMLSAVALGAVLVRLGTEHWAEAARCYETAIGLADLLHARSVLALARLGAAELAAAQGDSGAALRHVEPALAICRDLRLERYRERAEQLLTELSAPARAQA